MAPSIARWSGGVLMVVQHLDLRTAPSEDTTIAVPASGFTPCLPGLAIHVQLDVPESFPGFNMVFTDCDDQGAVFDLPVGVFFFIILERGTLFVLPLLPPCCRRSRPAVCATGKGLCHRTG